MTIRLKPWQNCIGDDVNHTFWKQGVYLRLRWGCIQYLLMLQWKRKHERRWNRNYKFTFKYCSWKRSAASNLLYSLKRNQRIQLQFCDNLFQVFLLEHLQPAHSFQLDVPAAFSGGDSVTFFESRLSISESFLFGILLQNN